MRIETERLLLRPLEIPDARPLAKLWSDAEVTRYMGGPRDPGEIQELLEEEARAGPTSEIDLWPVIEKASGEVVGHCGLLDKQVDGRDEIELIYVFNVAAWGKGYATEMGIAIRDYAFDRLGLRRIIALIDPENEPSKRVAEKVGMRFEKETLRPGGKLLHVYGMDSEARLGDSGGAAMRLTLSARPPFSLSSVIRSHGWIRLAPFAEDDRTGGLTYVAQLESGRVVAMLVREVAGGVGIEVDGELSDAERAEIACRVEWMLGLDQDFSAFYALARDEPKLAHVEERAQGRVLRAPTLFEDVVKTILTTNTSWSGTIRMVEALVSGFGAPLPADPTRRAFPAPDRLAAADEETLRSSARLGYRAPYVLELARGVSSGALDLESLKTAAMPTVELRKRLLAIKGVGEYAAANLLVLLGRYDFIPVDSWALKVVADEWHDGEPVGRAEVEAAFERWGEWKGLAYWLWDWSYLNEV